MCGAIYQNDHAACAKDGARLVGARLVPGRMRDPLVITLSLSILVAGLTFGLPTSIIARRANELDKAQFHSLGGILRNLACSRGHGEACNDIGQGYSNMKDYTRAVAFFAKACDMGYADSCHSLGQM
jgi:TPR repeat protein